MKKIIIQSIKPQYLEQILKGAKTIEIRKSLPKCDFPIDIYLYCSKNPSSKFGGKIVAKYTLNHIVRFNILYINGKYHILQDPSNRKIENVKKQSCLGLEAIYRYANKKELYGWFIDNLVVFNQSIKLTDFYSNNMVLRRPPQSWQYIMIDNLTFSNFCKKQLEKELGFEADEIVLIETEQNADNPDGLPYYYLFVYKGKRYKYIFGKLIVETDEN